MPRVYALQHLAAEPLGIIAEALEVRGIAAEYVRLFDRVPVPNEMRDAAGLIVMGGSMGAYEQDKYPFLSGEIRLIEAALKAEKPVLGICLGSQLLATRSALESKRAIGRRSAGSRSRSRKRRPLIGCLVASKSALPRITGTAMCLTCRAEQQRWPHRLKRNVRRLLTRGAHTGFCFTWKQRRRLWRTWCADSRRSLMNRGSRARRSSLRRASICLGIKESVNRCFKNGRAWLSDRLQFVADR